MAAGLRPGPQGENEVGPLPGPGPFSGTTTIQPASASYLDTVEDLRRRARAAAQTINVVGADEVTARDDVAIADERRQHGRGWGGGSDHTTMLVDNGADAEAAQHLRDGVV